MENIDIYAYVWKTHDYKLINNISNIVDFEFIDPIEDFPDSQYSQYFCLQYACKKFEEYTIKKNIFYDYIIRSRTDIYLHNKIDNFDFTFDKLYVASNHWCNNKLFDDNIMLMSQENYIKIFSNIYYFFLEGLNLRSPHPEEILYRYLKSINMLEKINRTQKLDFKLTRCVITS